MVEMQQDELWVALAELFFLDTEFNEEHFINLAARLKESGWDRERTEKELVQFIAPVAGANLGYLIWPVIGEWAGFDRTDLCAKIRSAAAHREKHPNWYFFLSDRHSRWMLKKLDAQRLLEKL